MDEVTIELDIVNESEDLDVILPRMTEGFSISYEVVTLEGPGGGWPVVRFCGSTEELTRMLENEWFPDPIDTYIVSKEE